VTTEVGPQNVFMDRFALEPKVQRIWGVPHATWFTLMGIGGGMFVLTHVGNLQTRLGLFLDLPVADLVSFLAIAVGGVILIADLGHPLRFWRAVLNPGTSWISRGAIADFVFLGAGALLIAADLRIGDARPFSFLPWDSRAETGWGMAFEIVAMLSAVVVTFYAGQVLAAPRSIPYWNSWAVPAQFVLSSAASAAAILMLLQVIKGLPVGTALLWVTVISLALLLLVTAWHLRTQREAPGKSNSLATLLRGDQRVQFLGGVLGAGSVLPLVIAVIGLSAPGAREVAAVLCFALTVPAGFMLRLVTLRVGIFPPVRSMLPVMR
jgi:formate-dependent nitrite reductase membrane component NrfD